MGTEMRESWPRYFESVSRKYFAFALVQLNREKKNVNLEKNLNDNERKKKRVVRFVHCTMLFRASCVHSVKRHPAW